MKTENAVRFALLAFSVLLASPFVRAEMLRNESFEEWPEGESGSSIRANSWYFEGPALTREMTMLQTAGNEYATVYHYDRVEDDALSRVYQDVGETIAGKKYRFKVYAYIDTTANMESMVLSLHPNHGGPAVASERFALVDLARNQWVRLTVAGASPTPGLRVQIEIKPGDSTSRAGTITLDDPSLIPFLFARKTDEKP